MENKKFGITSYSSINFNLLPSIYQGFSQTLSPIDRLFNGEPSITNYSPNKALKKTSSTPNFIKINGPLFKGKKNKKILELLNLKRLGPIESFKSMNEEIYKKFPLTKKDNNSKEKSKDQNKNQSNSHISQTNTNKGNENIFPQIQTPVNNNNNTYYNNLSKFLDTTKTFEHMQKDLYNNSNIENNNNFNINTIYNNNNNSNSFMNGTFLG